MSEDDYYDEGPLCHSCDGSVSPNAVQCPCGVFLQDMGDPFEGYTFEERMAAEVVLENEERAMYGAPLIPIL